MLPEGLIRKQRRAYAEMKAWVESMTRYEPNPEAFLGVPCGTGPESDETDDVTPFPDYDADLPPPEVYCQLPAADPPS